jgi:transcriptional regulator with XRE-family HTH domain
MDMRKLVGRNAARLCKAAGLTQEQLAERSGLSHAAGRPILFA